MKLKTILEKKPQTVTSNLFDFSINFTDAENNNYAYNISIPELYVRASQGERKVFKYIEKVLKGTYGYVKTDTEIDSTFYSGFLIPYLTMVLSKYNYKWSQVLRMMYTSFKPEDNVFEYTTLTLSYGAQEETNTIGEAVQTTSMGQQVTTNLYGEDKTTEVNGPTETTNTYGETTTNSTNQVNPFNDTDTLYDREKDNTVNEEHTDTESTLEVTNTTTIDSKTDTITAGQHTDTLTADEHTDILSKEAYTDTQTTNRHGNIGVTTTIAMFNEFQEYLNNYGAFWDIILRDILHEITEGY